MRSVKSRALAIPAASDEKYVHNFTMDKFKESKWLT